MCACVFCWTATGDLSTNNWFWALFGAGEGWHHNHHAFKYSARMGLEVRNTHILLG